MDITTGDPDWDAAFTLSQKTAFGLLFPGGQNLPSPSFVLARNPDQGFSRRGDGFDYTFLWNGQAPLESYYLGTLLPSKGLHVLVEAMPRVLSAVPAAKVVVWAHNSHLGDASATDMAARGETDAGIDAATAAGLVGFSIGSELKL